MPGNVAARVLSIVVLLASGCAEGGDASGQVTIFAAASTADVITEAAARFEARTSVEVVASFDASSTLAKQIITGAPADIFLSADQRWMDEAANARAIRADLRIDLLANELVLIVPHDSPIFEIEFTADRDLRMQAPHVQRLAIADPSHVPAGRYSKRALESLGWWSAVEPMIVPALDVRAALRLVEIGEVDAGIVYATDAARSEKVRVLAAIPAELHEPIHYPIALCSDNASAAEFLTFLRSDEMRRVFEDAGFRVLAVAPAGAPN